MPKCPVCTLLTKEINYFFNSLTGITVVVVFLMILGLFLWVFPGEYNIIESGQANLNGLFNLSPFIFLFIIPAITMRIFADENRAGTMEMLLTKPLTDMEVIVAKWGAAFLVVLIAMLPTATYILTVSSYALPPGIDTGALWGSYAGLMFIAATFVSIGVFSSAQTDSQIVSFIIALFLSGFFYLGFELAHAFALWGPMDLFVKNLGGQAHYVSMSRGVLDSRDIIYFLSVNALFIMLTKIKLESRKWLAQGALLTASGSRDLRRKHMIALISGLMIVAAANFAGSVSFARIDLTTEKRHSLTGATRQMLSGLDDIVYFRVYLEGDFPAGFRQLRNQAREVLDEFAAWSDMIQYEFVNPVSAGNGERVQEYFDMLVEKGLQPTQVQVRADDATSQQLIFPGAIASYKGKEIPVQLLRDQAGLPSGQVLNNSAQLLEYTFASAVKSLISGQMHTIGFLDGNASLSPAFVADITSTLSQYYRVERTRIEANFENVKHLSTLVIAGPQQAFSESDKYIIDQYIMHGGAVLWLIDPVMASMDSLQQPPHESIGMAWPLNLDDMLFRYGVRLNANLLQDLQAAPIAVTTGFIGERPQISLLPWPFFPLAGPAGNHPVVRNLNLVKTEFVSSIDTVAVAGIDKIPLLQTSAYTRILPAPAHIALSVLQDPVKQELFNAPPQTVAVLMEGQFESVFANRVAPETLMPQGFTPLQKARHTSMIVISDGDVIKNQVTPAGTPYPLGYDRFSGETFGNKDFILNAIDYLTDGSGIIQARTKEIRMRMLDMNRVRASALQIKVVNVAIPVLVIILAGLIRILWRKWRYTH